MPLDNAALVVAANALAGELVLASLHTAQPDGTGSNESTAGREAIALNVGADGTLSLPATVHFTGGAAGGPCTHVGLWNAAGTTWYGWYALTGDQTFNAAGEYDLTGLTIDETAT